MTTYCVVWSDDGFWNEDDAKIFEDYNTALCFLKLQCQNHSYVKLFEAEVT